MQIQQPSAQRPRQQNNNNNNNSNDNDNDSDTSELPKFSPFLLITLNFSDASL